MRSYYSSSIKNFIAESEDSVIGKLVNKSRADVDRLQVCAWKRQIAVLQTHLPGLAGNVYFEFSIPRMGKRIDVLLLLPTMIVVLEFKVGEGRYTSAAFEQVWDYALDLKNFHSTSHAAHILPVLVATDAPAQAIEYVQSLRHMDGVYEPIRINANQLPTLLCSLTNGHVVGPDVVNDWEAGAYRPSPTIIEAALTLYRSHNVENIRTGGATELQHLSTVDTVQSIIRSSKDNKNKSICFVTGVPGAGKTLVGLDVATQNFDHNSELFSVYLSGNGPLVKILQEVLARDLVAQRRNNGESTTLGEARSQVKAFIQNVHHFRDECMKSKAPPIDHVAIFDEAQRAWDKRMTSDFMQRKKGISDFEMSESQYLISCMDRHEDWAVVICLVGGGQEINRGEGGIDEWLVSIEKSFPDWKVYCSPQLIGSNYVSLGSYSRYQHALNIEAVEDLHLSTSLRSFRAASLSDMVNSMISLDLDSARAHYQNIRAKYPLVITRDLDKAKHWLKTSARGSERYGIVVSSNACRLRPHAIDVRNKIDPVHWFLDGKSDVRSSFYLEDVATEFQVQGLELDWVCVTWDADLRLNDGKWNHHNFVGSKWQRVKKSENQKYLENAYRVLMTRARQGMVLVVPAGSDEDATRKRSYYDPTYKLLKSLGFPELQ